GAPGGRAVMRFVGGHLAQDRAAFLVGRGPPAHVVVEMRLALPLRLGDEPEAQLVAEASRDEADAEAAGVPERAERARPVAELVETRLAPNEVVAFLACGTQQLLASRGAARADRLSRLKRLRGHPAGETAPPPRRPP